MIKRVFIDTDIILDVALAREPFLQTSKKVLSLLEHGSAAGFISSNEVANLYYILRKIGGDSPARNFINALIKFLTVISINHSDVINGLHSSFSDFEDSLQYFSAARNKCSCIVTRNIADYRYADIKIYVPEAFLKIYG